MDDLFEKYLKSNKAIAKPKQPSLGEMNRSVHTNTSNIPTSIPVLPKSSQFQPDPTVLKYSDTVNPMPLSDNIYTMGVGGGPRVKDTRQTTYVNNNYAGDDYVD